MMDWTGRLPDAPGRRFLVHGKSVPADSLRRAIEEEHGFECTVAEHMQQVEL